ncbi:MAG TPA: hypothetical protein VHZ03_14235 [Trebonia sp.]|jgi:hypothetical protein|nr:hypothetical protein [Trebonia sp.]
MTETAETEASAPRCPECCQHGILLTRPCGWCENDYDPDHAADAWIPDDQPMWKCPHGIGVDPEDEGAARA